MNVAICIATYKRPDGLKRLLDSFAAMDYGAEKFAVFIADNDAAGADGLAFVERNRASYPFKIFCEVENRPGISHARNKSLAILKDSGWPADYVAFTDDDNIVSPFWLSDLVRTSQVYGGDIINGKCEPLFEVTPDPSILYSSFYLDNFGSPPTGTAVNSAGTNNMLVRRAVFDKMGYAPFDPALATFGGEDVDFVTRLLQNGFRLVQCACGTVYETFPADRLTEEWILKRYYRGGCSYGWILKNRMGGKAFVVGVVKKAVIFPVRYLKAKFQPTSQNKSKLAESYGFFNYVLTGRLYEEYKRPA